MNNESSFSKVVRYKKYRDIYNTDTMEVRVSLISSIIITTLIIIVFNQANIDNINNLMREMTKEIAIVLIGFLGFVISGLAILTSSISNKFINILKRQDKINIIEKILLSFYFLGLIVGIDIISSLIMYITTYSTYPYNILCIGICTFLYTYTIVFIIFYSIALIGNCIEIFKIINTVDEDIDASHENINDDRYLYMSFRMTALENVFFTNQSNDTLEKIKKYYELMNKLIDEGCKDEIQKGRLKAILKNKFNYLDKNSKLNDSKK
ncbi:hypothetical protein [Clostridium magnum]|uniref:Uncharacterized protein n=1 Tax=Clostridium magnum DSM 2767 TaxID=1121326 RepID=A0A162QYY1_9CLOT|nr:hypothetical protein [Clostridium magnum]KZL89171.1 hypothetical protein CLMAG_53890 [Clostridium magnum DSM 2767]SHJ24861.1 hypothetical protein SAMN02745944_05605 [Clostridium magnum DSM 2767]